MLLSFLSLVAAVSSSFQEDLLQPPRSSCYSCASFAYLPLWHKLMHHYFPPKNFTDRCWQPDNGIETVSCSSACFTLVERIDQHDYVLSSEYHGVMRGCVDRLLLFGVDDDVRNVLAAPSATRLCRQTDRKLLRLFPLSSDSQLVTLCSCTGERCNDQDMLVVANSQNGWLWSTAVLLFAMLL